MGSLDRQDDHSLTIAGLDDFEKMDVCTMIREGRGVAAALASIGKFPNDLHAALTADQEFDQSFQMALAVRDEAVEAALHAKALKGNVTAMKFWLANRRPGEWAETRTVRHTGEVGGEVTVRHTVTALRELLTEGATRDDAVAWIERDTIIDVEALPAGDEPAGEGEVPGEAGGGDLGG